MSRIHYCIAALSTVALVRSQDTEAEAIRRRYVDLTRSWADVRFTAAERKTMIDGRRWEPLLLKGPADPLASRILAPGEPSFDSVSRNYPGKILDRTVLGTYSDPEVASQYNDEFAIYWNGAIAANLQKRKLANGVVRPVAHNTVVVFRVGADREIFGTDRDAFSPMRCENGYLPVVTGTYRKDGIEYRETAFAGKPEGETGWWDVAFIEFEMKNSTATPRNAAIAADDAGYYNYRLRKGETDRFLLGLYSRLAHVMSRNLYVSSEGSPFIEYNTEKGSFVGAAYSFPNSASNADTLLMLRNALVLEELENNVETGTLDLLSGAPRQWFEKGKSIKVSRMPTYHGNISFSVDAAPDGHTINAEVHLPPDAGCKQVRVHFRHPRGRRIQSASIHGSKWSDSDFAKGVVKLNGGTSTASIKVTF